MNANSKRIALSLLVIAWNLTVFAELDLPKTIRSDDPSIARILQSLNNPSTGSIEINEISIPTGEYTHCETQTHGTRTVSDCAPRTHFEHVHRLVLTFVLNGQSVEVVGGCSSFEHNRKCQLISLGFLGIPECVDRADHEGKLAQRVCTEKGTGTFILEKNKDHYYIYPVQNGKPNRRYYIPLATINKLAVVTE